MLRKYEIVDAILDAASKISEKEGQPPVSAATHPVLYSQATLVGDWISGRINASTLASKAAEMERLCTL